MRRPNRSLVPVLAFKSPPLLGKSNGNVPHARRLILAFAAIAMLPFTAMEQATARTWTDNTGNFSVDADFVKLEEGQVHLKRLDTKRIIRVPIDRLSSADQQRATRLAKGADPAGRAAVAVSADDEGASDTTSLSAKRDNGKVVLKYRVPELGTLSDGEWPSLVVFLGRSDGPTLNETVIHAKDRRSGVSGQFVITSQAVFELSQIAQQGKLCGYRITDNDRKKERIRSSAELEIPLKSFESLRDGFGISARPSFELRSLGDAPKATAAVAAFKTVEGNCVFQRFLTKFAVLSPDHLRDPSEAK